MSHCNRWLIDFKNADNDLGQPDMSRALNQEAWALATELQASRHAMLPELPLHVESSTYQLVLLKLLQTCILTGDTDWQAFVHSSVALAKIQALKETWTNPCAANVLRQEGVGAEDLHKAWINCQYNFAATLTYLPCGVPDHALVEGLFSTLLNRCLNLYDGLLSVGYTESPRVL